MPRMIGEGLSRREREIMDILHRNEQATVAEVEAALPSAPSYSAVRTLLRILEEKGHVRHLAHGRRFVYIPTQPRKRAARSALRQVIETFFSGSLEQAVTAFLADADTRLSDQELQSITEAIEAARIREETPPQEAAKNAPIKKDEGE